MVTQNQSKAVTWQYSLSQLFHTLSNSIHHVAFCTIQTYYKLCCYCLNFWRFKGIAMLTLSFISLPINHFCYQGLVWPCHFIKTNNFFIYSISDGLECVGHSFAYVAHFCILSNVWIRTQRAAVESRRTTNLATHLPKRYIILITIIFCSCDNSVNFLRSYMTLRKMERGRVALNPEESLIQCPKIIEILSTYGQRSHKFYLESLLILEHYHIILALWGLLPCFYLY